MNVHVHFKFVHVLKLVVPVQVDTVDPALSNSMPMDLLNVRAVLV